MSWWLRVWWGAEKEVGKEKFRACCKTNCKPSMIPDRQEPPVITERDLKDEISR